MTAPRATSIAAGTLPLVVALGACLGGAKRAAEPSGRTPTDTVTRGVDGVMVHRDGRCRPFHDVVQREHAIAQANEAALARALTEAGLTDAATRFDPPDSYPAGGDQPLGWQVVDASDRRVVLSPATYQACGAGNPWRLALDLTGAAVVLVVQAHPVARHELSVCGCEVDVPISCGGAAPEQAHWRWTLPRGVEFKGPLSLVVDDESARRVFAGRGDGRACPTPTAPP